MTMGELKVAQARPEWDRMPRKALLSKACGEQSEDVCSACRDRGKRDEPGEMF